MSERYATTSTHRRRPSRAPYGMAMIFAALLVLAAWQMRDSFQPVIAGQPAPMFVAENLAGEVVTLADFDGKVRIINIWATWCPPCVEEMPSMERLYQDIGDADFEILAVSVDAALGETDDSGRPGASQRQIADFAEEHGLTFEILRQPSGTIQQVYQISGVPESFIITRDGVIHRRLSGPTVWDHPRYRELILDLLAG